MTRPNTLIDVFSVRPDDDESFIADWELARDLLMSRNACREPVLHRALREEVDLRFVSVARVDSPQAWKKALSDPALEGFASSLYEVMREDGSADVEGGAVLIDPFELPDGQDERFLAGWERARKALAQQRGYLGTRLSRSLGPAEFRFVAIVRWSSPLMYARALQRPDVMHVAQALPARSQPALYQVIRG